MREEEERPEWFIRREVGDIEVGDIEGPWDKR